VVAAVAIGAGALALIAGASPASAQATLPPGGRAAADAIAIKATSKVTFAYVITGDATADETSRRGLIGLGKFLTARTAVEPGDPSGVNIATETRSRSTRCCIGLCCRMRARCRRRCWLGSTPT
jgi:hypothetical protein